MTWRASHLLLLAGLLLLAFWLRLADLDRYPPGLSNDEAINAVDVLHFLETGNFPLYEDRGRPEPLFRLVQAGGVTLFGKHVWAYRFISTLFGTLTVAVAYWAARECLYDVRRDVRRIAALAAAGVLTAMLGHLTITRTTYRAVPQPLFTLLFAGFWMRGLRTKRYRDFILSAVSMAGAMYSYTAAPVLPGTIGVVGLSLLVFRRKTWRTWLPRLAVLSVTVAVLMLPVEYFLVTRPEAVIGRAVEVSEVHTDWGYILQQYAAQFFTTGDENPQYNVAHAPLLPPLFMWLFLAGLVALVTRVRHPSSALLASLLVLSAIPVIFTEEITHGLRIVGEFAAIPIIVGAGVAMLLVLTHRILQPPRRVLIVLGLGAVSVITLADSVYARQTYVDYWEHPERWLVWQVHGRELDHNEWFFRPDRREFARWVTEQDQPLLIPMAELSKQTTRTWLQVDYPTMDTASDAVTLPDDTLLVVPWSLEQGDLMQETRLYALLQNDTITTLPPLSRRTHSTLLAGIDDAETITRPEGTINLLAHVKPVPNNVPITFEPATLAGEPLATFGHDELQLVSWRGPDVIRDEGALTYTLDWRALGRIGHVLTAFLQLRTQGHERIAGHEAPIWRWVFPSSIWQAGDVVPDPHTLSITQDLEPGAYRLVTGLYVWVDAPIQASSNIGEVVDNAATIGWVKVPQREMPTPAGTTVDAILGDMFVLRAASAEQMADGRIHVRLFWESLVERPAIDATVFVHLLDESGNLDGRQSDIRPWNGQYPTFIWSEDEIVQTDHIIDIGASDVGELAVSVGMYTFPDFERLTVTQDGTEISDRVADLGNLEALLDGD